MVLSDRSIREEIDAGRIVVSPLGEGCIQPASVDVHLDDSILVFRNSRRPYIDVRQAQDGDGLTEMIEIGGDVPFISCFGPRRVRAARQHHGRSTRPATSTLAGPTHLVACRRRWRARAHSWAAPRPRTCTGPHSSTRARHGQDFTRPGVGEGPPHPRAQQRVGNLPVTLYAGMKIGQISFLRYSVDGTT